MSATVEPGFAPEACTECECAANSWHYPGCSSAPYVCPGCYAMGADPHASYCPDGAIEDELRDRLDRGEDESDLNDGEDWEWTP